MSIIEKAADKSDQIEKKMASRETPSQSPGVQACPEPVYAAHPDVAKASTSEHYPDITTRSRSNQVVIDLARLHQRGIITPRDEQSQTAEEFRIIKRPLIINAFNKIEGQLNKGNLIMVTSAIEGEGRTFCAINLAMSIAMEKDHTVLLIDADVARPSLPDYLGLKEGKGLLDVLLDDSTELADVILRTNVPRLSVLLCGRKSSQATELLASQSMMDLMMEISHRYSDRIVIFDSPPILSTTESRALAAQMGQIVMVASETTQQKTVLEALRDIEACNDIKLIYNKVKLFTTGGKYNYK